MSRFLPVAALVAITCCLAGPVWGANAPEDVFSIAATEVPVTDPVNFLDLNTVSDCDDPDMATFKGNRFYTVTLTGEKLLTIGVEDCCCIGDYYRVTINGVDFFTSPNPADTCPAGTDPWGCVTGDCTDLSTGSKAILLAPGIYTIEVYDEGFKGHTAQEIDDENMCGAAFTVTMTTEDLTCAEVQADVIDFMPEPSAFKNRGKYVSAAANYLDSKAFVVNAECHSCIINQFARRVPQASMAPCEDYWE